MTLTSAPAKIRPASQQDLVAIETFILPFVADGKLLPRTISELGQLLKTLFVAERDGQIVGCAALEIYSPKLAEIRSLAVSPAVQGSGVGKLLVNACLELAKQHNILEVMAITSSDAFFLACGFDFTLPGEKKALFYQTRDSANQSGT
jgi:amino-acid N-acetyltransferase